MGNKARDIDWGELASTLSDAYDIASTAYKVGRWAYALSRRSRDMGRFETLLNDASEALEAGEWDAAGAVLRELEPLAKLHRNRQMKGAYLNTKGLLYHLKGDSRAAIPILTEALDIAFRDDNEIVQGYIQYYLGEANERLKQYKAAVESFAVSATYFERNDGNEAMASLAYGRLSGNLIKTEQMDAARGSASMAFDLASKARDPESLGESLLALARVQEVEDGTLDDAVQMYDHAAELYERIEDYGHLVETMVRLALVHQRRGNSRKAKSCLKKAAKTASAHGVELKSAALQKTLDSIET